MTSTRMEWGTTHTKWSQTNNNSNNSILKPCYKMGLPPSYALLIEYAQQIVTGCGSTENTIIKRLEQMTTWTEIHCQPKKWWQRTAVPNGREVRCSGRRSSVLGLRCGDTLAALRVPLSVIGSLSGQPYPINPPLTDNARGYPICLSFLLSQHFRSNVQRTQVSPQLLYTPS